MILAHKIELRPTRVQAQALSRACGVARFTWNWALVTWKSLYEAGEKPTAAKLKKLWNQIKVNEFPWVYDSPKDANQQPFTNLNKAFRNFFRRVKEGKKPGYPRFKKKGQHDAFYVSNDKFRIEDKGVLLPKLGRVKMRERLRFDGRVMSGVVSRTAGRWFLSINVDVGEYHRPRVADNKTGIDLGLTTFATLSTGEKIDAPRPLENYLKSLARRSRVLSHKQKSSGKRKKAVQALARLHYRIANIRRDFLHKLTTRLCRENQAIGIEDLAVKNMVKNHYLARSISDSGWAEFRRQLGYKAQIYGTEIKVIDRFFPSSKTCSGCGCVKDNLSLTERIFDCPHCGLSIDRDVNAAINLLPQALGKVTPVDSRRSRPLVEMGISECSLTST